MIGTHVKLEYAKVLESYEGEGKFTLGKLYPVELEMIGVCLMEDDQGEPWFLDTAQIEKEVK